MRLRMVLAGFARYGEMEQVGESSVAFACGMTHEALMRVLLPYSPKYLQRRNDDGRRGPARQMTTGTLGFSQT